MTLQLSLQQFSLRKRYSFLKNTIFVLDYKTQFMSQRNQTLGEFIIENQSSFKYSSGELSRLINSIRLAAKVVNHEVNKAGLVDIIGAAGDTNIQGEDQQKLDVYAKQLPDKTILPAFLALGGFREDARKLCELHGIGTAERIAFF